MRNIINLAADRGVSESACFFFRLQDDVRQKEIRDGRRRDHGGN